LLNLSNGELAWARGIPRATLYRRLMSGGVSDYGFSMCWEEYRIWTLNRLVRLATAMTHLKDISRADPDILRPRCCNAIIDLVADELA
jgi:hypothetical protein